MVVDPDPIRPATVEFGRIAGMRHEITR